MFLSVRDADKPEVLPIAEGLADLGFELLSTAGTARSLASAGLAVRGVEKGAAIVEQIRRGRCDLVINTPEESERAPRRLPHPRGRARRA